jgi:uncharacterized membrane protein
MSGRWAGIPLPVRSFLAAAVVLLLATGVLLPPLQGSDEHAHFLRACTLAQGQAVPEMLDRRVGAWLPTALTDEAWSPFFSVIEKPEPRIRRADVGALWAVRDEGGRLFTDFPNTAYHGPAAYLPSAAGIALARMVTSRPLAWLYAGRLANAAAWMLLMAAAIQTVPTGRWVLAALALIPGAVIQAVTLGQDAPTTALAFLLFACLARLASEAETGWGWGRIAALAVLGAVVAISKYVYSSLLVLAIPSLWPFRSPKGRRAWQLLVVLGLPAVVMLGWILAVRHTIVPYEAYHPDHRDGLGGLYAGSDSAGQIRYLLAHPLGVLGEIWRHVTEYRIFERLASWFGWDMALPPRFSRVLWPGLGLLAWADVRRRGWAPGFRALLAPVVLVSVLGIYLIAFIWWSPAGPRMMDLIHGRYLLPLLPPAAFLLGSRRPDVPVRWKAVLFWALVAWSGAHAVAAIPYRYYWMAAG